MVKNMNSCTRFRGKGDWDAQEKDRASVYFHYLNRLISVCELFKNKRKLHKGMIRQQGWIRFLWHIRLLDTCDSSV